MLSDTTVGCRAIEVPDPTNDTRIPAWILYPARGEARLERFGPYALEVAMDAPFEGDERPLVVVSHGNGGSPWTHRGTAAHLAREGFVVALVEHIGNSRSDNRLAFTAQNLANRPRQLGLVLDAVFQDDDLGPRIAKRGIAIIGQSIGAYTALALAGGRPTSYPQEEPDGIPRPVPVVRDPRVHALVLLAPASAWYRSEGALADVDVPILLRTGERDDFAPPWHGELVLRGVADPSRVDHRVVPNAGHFSFQSPFPPEMTRPDFAPSQDPPGFDRPAYLSILDAEITAFLRRAL